MNNPAFATNRISASDSVYPIALKSFIGMSAPEFIDLIGNEGLLHTQSVALLCSSKCPGQNILAGHDLAAQWAVEGKCVISGFQSPVEKECLRVLLRGNDPLIVCPARSLHGMRIPAAWREPIEKGRLLLLSPFKEYEDRNRANLAEQRNKIVAALAAEVFVVHASPGGKLEALCAKLAKTGKPVRYIDKMPV